MCLGMQGQIVEVTDRVRKLAIVNVAGVKRTINIGCIVDDEHCAQSCVGAWVLVHVGFAMSRIDEDEAERTLELLTQIGEVQAELDAMNASAPP